MFDVTDNKWQQVTTGKQAFGGAFLPLAGGTMAGNIVMGNNDINGLNSLGFTDVGGQIAGSVSAPHMNFVLTGDSLFRWTTNAKDLVDLSDGGFEFKADTHIFMNANELYFDDEATSNYRILWDGATSLDFRVPTGGSFRWFINVTNHVSIGATNFTLSGLDIVMGNGDITGIQALNFTDAGGQINTSALSMSFSLTGASIYTFTANAADIVKFSDGDGIVMQGTHPIDMVNNKLDNVSQIEFNEVNQTITDNTNGMRFSLPDATDTYDFTIDSEEVLSLEKFFADFGDTTIQLTEKVAPSAPVATVHYVYVDSTTKELTIKHNASTVSLESGSQTPWTSDIDADGFDLIDVGEFQFDNALQRMVGSVNGVDFYIPSNDEWRWFSDGSEIMTIREVTQNQIIELFGQAANDFTTFKAINSAGNKAASLQWDDLQGIGRLSASDELLLTSTVITVIGGIPIKSHSVTEIGFQVTNASITIGTEGTVQIPHLDATVPATKAAIDADFGNQPGCCGVYLNTTANTSSFVARQSDGSWSGVSMTHNLVT